MAGHSEEHGNFKIEQIQVDGWVEGTYNTYVKYCGKTLAIKYHRHATEREQREIDTSDTLYNMTNELDIIDRCNLYKDLLNDIAYLKLKMTMKIKNGFKYKFDMEFVNYSLKKIVNEVRNNIQEIYTDLQFEAISKGRQFYIPLPDYTIQNETTEDHTENGQRTDIAIKGNLENEILEIINKDVKFIIELLKELQQKKERPGYIEGLIEQGYIADDGKTVLTSLDNVAEYLQANIESVTPKLLISTFLQYDGAKYSMRTAQDAIQRTKTP